MPSCFQALSAESAGYAQAITLTRRTAVEIGGRDVQTRGIESLPENEPPLTKAPAECVTKEDVRAELDRIDHALLVLFAERHGYVTRMASIKTDPHEAYDPVRIKSMLDKQRKRAEEMGLDEDKAELI